MPLPEISRGRRLSILRRTVVDTLAYLIARPFAGAGLKSLRPIAPLRPSDIVLLLVVRNEAGRLGPFLSHYRRLGVARFAVVDDQSTDDTPAFLSEQPDVDLFVSSLRYSEAGRGNRWRQQLAAVYGMNRWYVVVDSDEYLVYDGMERHPLPDLAEFLSKKRVKRLMGPMIDLYPRGPLRDVGFDPEKMPWQVADHFDPTGYRATYRPQNIRIRGGARSRLFGYHTLTKYPFLRWDRLTILHRSIHSPLPYSRNHIAPLGALLHFKFFDDFSARAKTAVAEGQYWNGAAKYRRYLEKTREKSDILVANAESRLYRGPEDLLAAGLIQPISWDAGEQH